MEFMSELERAKHGCIPRELTICVDGLQQILFPEEEEIEQDEAA